MIQEQENIFNSLNCYLDDCTINKKKDNLEMVKCENNTINNLFALAVNELQNTNSIGKVFVNTEELHVSCYIAKPGANLLLNNNTLVNSYNFPISSQSDKAVNYVIKNNIPMVSIGTQLVSGINCFLSCYLTSNFFAKDNGAMINSLKQFIRQKLTSKNNKDVYDDSKKNETSDERTKKWRKEGKFMARITWPYNDKGTIKWKDHKAVDLLEWEHVIDYVKDTQSLTFIKQFIERYRRRIGKEPTIGKLHIPLQDYVDFFTIKKEGKEIHNGALMITAIGLERNGHGNAQSNNTGKYIYGYNKSFNFNNLLEKIINTNRLKININEFNRILETKHNAKDLPTKMFVLAQESEKLLKSIENYVSSQRHSVVYNSTPEFQKGSQKGYKKEKDCCCIII